MNATDIAERLQSEYYTRTGVGLALDILGAIVDTMMEDGGLTTGTSEADQLWEALQLEPHDQVTEAVLVAKIADFENGGTAVSVSATDGCDWITQLGILHAALLVIDQSELVKRD